MSEVLSRAITTSSARRAKTIMIFAPKGGVGKTMMASNLLVAAARAGYKVAGLDFDGQRTFTRWGQKRLENDSVQELIRNIDVRGAHIKDWRSELHLVRNYDIILIDTPPGVDKYSQDYLQEMGDKVDFVLMPTEVYPQSVEAVMDFMTLWEAPSHAALVLNKIIPNRTITGEAREMLQERGEVWDGGIPMRDDLARIAGAGAAATDDERLPGHEPFMKLWKFCAGRIGVTA